MQRHGSRNIIFQARRWVGVVAALLLAACAGDQLLSPDGARPSATASPLVSITPGSAVVGDTGVVLTLRGSGFNDSTWIYAESTWLYTTTTFVDDSTLSVRIEHPLWEAVTHQLRVVTDWEASDPVPFVVSNPVPVISSVSPDWCETNGSCTTITLTGSNFVYGMDVRWNGSSVNYNYVSETQVTINLDPYYLQWPQQVEITAVNPGPGAVPSAPAYFHVGPRIVMHTHGATAGGSGFQLAVYGEDFDQSDVIYWNGAPRPTSFSSARRISTYLPASAVAAPGVATVSVNGQQIGTVTIRPSPAAVATSQLTLDLPVRDVAYSPLTGRLYGTVYDGPAAGYLAVIDPATATVEDYIWVGQAPRYTALSDDGRYLWVGVDGASQVMRVDLQYRYPDAQVQLDSLTVAEDLAVVPGKPWLVAVSRKNTCCSPRHEGVALYYAYSGAAQPLATASGIGSNVIEFGATGATLFGLDNETSDNRIRTMAADDNGVTLTATGWRLALYGYGDMVYAGGRLYINQGGVYDTGYDDWAIFFSGMSGAVRPDVQTGRAFFLTDNAIRVADINTGALLGTLAVPQMQFEHPSTQRRHLVRWGEDGLAWHDADQVFILRTPLAGN